ncbi:MAG: ribosome small subunit-dependent GTPase A, partial [Candidatus Coatesbacteria bacterium]|nr:ribosome small subunit-dependent GTPase A [Candidatus Coatesbacteria bacterium]
MSDAVEAAPTTDVALQGQVFRKALGTYFVNADGETVVCGVSNRLRKQLIYPTADPSSRRHRVDAVKGIRCVDPVAIGDIVSFVPAGDGGGMIKEVLPRRNKFTRKASGKKDLEQVVVANVDQIVVVMAAARPSPRWNLLDRYLIDAESAELDVVVCITKMDLLEDESLEDDLRDLERIGYKVVRTSAVTGDGMDLFKECIMGRLSVLVGKSGVGKTTLLNAIQPELGLKVKEVSDSTNKGKHTTTHLEMFTLDIGGSVIDTPGMR